MGALLFTFLPGGWITFGLRLPGFSFGARVGTGLVLAPVVLPAQLYLLRAAGIPFETAAVLLIALNLPVAWLAAMRFERRRLDRRGVVQGVLLVLLCAACLAPQILDVQSRAYSGHAWMYADTSYFSANGVLDLEEAEAAGVRLAYPWAGLVFQSVVSFLAGSPPVMAYIWMNLLWLSAVGWFTASIVSEIGGERTARAAGVIGLYLGVNFCGYFLLQTLRGLGRMDDRYLYALFGDGRVTPWLAKFLFLQQEPLALGLFIALLFASVHHAAERQTGGRASLAGVLLASLGLVYPILFPAGCAVVAAAAIAAWTPGPGRARPTGGAAALGAVLLGSVAVTFAFVAFVSRDRVVAMFRLSDAWWITAKLLSALVVLAPLLAALAVALRRSFELKRASTIILVGGLLGSLVPYVALEIGQWHNEYKFLLTAAVCAAPFGGVVFERLRTRLRGLTAPVLLLVLLVLALPLADKFRRGWPLEGGAGPRLDTRTFSLRLAEGERLAGMVDAIRERTPVSTLLVLHVDPRIHLSTLTRRQLFVAPRQSDPHPGVGDASERTVNQYDPRIFDERRRVVDSLFGAEEDSTRAGALARIGKLGRPVAIVADDRLDAPLVHWLEEEGRARLVYRDGDGSLWLVALPAASSAR